MPLPPPDSTENPGCSAIVVNYNAGPLLLQSVDALLQARAVVEVIVVDNASTDNSISELHAVQPQAMATGRLRIIRNQHNAGFARACNQGAEKATGQFMAFVNPDCLVLADTIATLVDAVRRNQKLALAGAWIENPDGTEQRATRRRLPTPWRVFATLSGLEKLAQRWPRQFSWLAGVNLNLGPKPPDPLSVEAVSGALMLMPQAEFEAIGGFDTGFPLHFEDLDLFARLQKAGRQIILVPAATAIHFQGSCSRDGQAIKRLKRYGLRRYWQKHSNNPLLKALVRLIPSARLPTEKPPQ
jgi:GT2 family glycosyltransferase